MKRNLNSWTLAAGAAVLLAGLGVFVYEIGGSNADQRALATLSLHDLKEIDAEWSLDVLRSKNEINKNYDAVSRPLQSLDSIETTLTALAMTVDAASLRAPAETLKRSFAEKIDLIDSFKMQNSVLKNSLRFLPTAVAQLKEQVQVAGKTEGSAATSAVANVESGVDRMADRILLGILHYSVLTDPSVKADAEGLLSQLSDLRPTQTENVATQIGVVIDHSRVILRQKHIEDDVLVEISRVPTARNIDALADSFRRVFEADALRQVHWRHGLVAYSIVLLALLTFAAFKLFDSYRSLNHAKGRLELANTTLEERVQKRTVDLSSSNAQLQAEIRERLVIETALEQRNGELKAVAQQLAGTHSQLLQSEKMASVGQLAAGVAHEINNPIAFVRSNLGSLRGSLSDLFDVLRACDEYEESNGDHALREQLRRIKAAVNVEFLREDIPALLAESAEGITRVEKIVRDLKEFSHVDRKEEWECVDIHQCLESSLNVAAHELKYKAILVRDYGDLPAVECLPFQINQVFLNLLVNAAQSFDVRGTITLRSGSDENSVWVQIADDGKGIAPEHVDHIFEPFFTTKPIGIGTGLGLSVSYGIVLKHAGSIEVASEVGVGTTFTIRLPREQVAVAA